MALSPQYSWPEPDNSSLVKNGAQDIRALGDAIDTSVWNVGYGQAGKNKIINGDFGVNQRAFTSSTTHNVFNYDRFIQIALGDGTTTSSAQTFTPGAAPVSGYEAQNYFRMVTAGQTTTAVLSGLRTLIEDVRTFAGQTATVSFWAKANSGTPKIAIEMTQNFGSGGSASVNNYAGQVTLSTSWARYFVTLAVPSITGKTIGTSSSISTSLYVSAGSDFNARTGSLGIQSNTFEIWGMQAEYGSKATPFQTASGGSPQAELAMCQRYYYRLTGSSSGYYVTDTNTVARSTTVSDALFILPTTLRVNPTALEWGGTQSLEQAFGSGAAKTITSITLDTGSSPNRASIQIGVASGLTAGVRYIWYFANNSSAFLGLSAEL